VPFKHNISGIFTCPFSSLSPVMADPNIDLEYTANSFTMKVAVQEKSLENNKVS
jgi:hypothetical protein